MKQSFFFTPYLIFIITSFLLARKTICSTPQYLQCNPLPCGDGVNITYPFYIQDQQQSFCGYPGFNLSCHNGRPILRLENDDYVIREINYDVRTFRVSNAAVLDTNNSCVHLIRNTSLPKDRFELAPNQTALFLIYKCSSTSLRNDSTGWPIAARYKIDCLTENETMSFLSMSEDDPLLDSAAEFCESVVKVPVVEAYVGRGESTDDGIKRMLEGGFVLKWIANNCTECENSGGKCGFDNTTYHFKCFCRDRAHAWSCGAVGNNKNLKIGIWTGATAASVALLIIIFCCLQKRVCGKKKTQESESIEAFLRNYGPMAVNRYKYKQVKKMTMSFKEKLGQGGYGCVFKGKLLDGRHVAIKILKESKSNGEEFINEVSSISRTSHVNVVTLLGFCFEGSKRALIYEFMSNGSLEKHIFKNNSSTSNREFGWETLYEITLGIARGLEYLHRGCNTRILHLDIKPHNILLDENFCPKISDFGLAKICPGRESIISMTGMRGTAGYIAPEIFCRTFGGVSYKSDVYSYGMLVVEMVGARKNFRDGVDHRSSEIYFPDWIYKCLKLDEEFVLSGIENEEEKKIARKLIITSLWCTQTNPSKRPPMSRVVEMLVGSVESLTIPPIPSFSGSPMQLVSDFTASNEHDSGS